MPDSISWEPLPSWDRHTVLGRAVHDQVGTRLGPVADIYVGVRTGAPLWAVLDLGGQTRLIPAVTLVVLEDTLRIPFAAATVQAAPVIGAGAPLSAATERALRAHYDEAWQPAPEPGRDQRDEGGRALERVEVVPEGAVSLNALEARQLRAATVRLKRSTTHVSGVIDAREANAGRPAVKGELAPAPKPAAPKAAGGDQVRLRVGAPRRPSGPVSRPASRSQGGPALSRDLFGGGEREPAPRPTQAPPPPKAGGRRARRLPRRLPLLLAAAAGLVALVVVLVSVLELRGPRVTTVGSNPPPARRNVTVGSTPLASEPLPGADFEQPGPQGWAASPGAVAERVKGGRVGTWAASVQRLAGARPDPSAADWPSGMTGLGSVMPERLVRPGTAVRIVAWVKVTSPDQEVRIRLVRHDAGQAVEAVASVVAGPADGWRRLQADAVLGQDTRASYVVQVGAIDLPAGASILVDGVDVQTFPVTS